MFDYQQQPFVLAWELTRACNLACVHCRAEAQLRRDPRELTSDEAMRLVDEIASFDPAPTLILTGGDPMRRPDLTELIQHATFRGLRTALTPAGTALASRARLEAAKQAGLARVAVSLDGSTAERHDAFRRVAGSFGWTLAIARHAAEIGLPLQVHSTLSRQTVDDLPALADLADELGAVVWAVFCLVPTGRAQFADELDADEYERQFHWLAARAHSANWKLKLTEGYHFRRLMLQQAERPRPTSAVDGIGRAPLPVNAGNGFCFVSHIGDVCPSGFLPLVAGNVRQDSLVELYQRHPLFRALRDPALLRGKCGGCEFRAVCGGSRSRAFAHTGDYLASDPACAYQPLADHR
ncbi:MAG TPA: TIGR04053 family radical SAM/SPASM domain-containing protein [Nitrolancea sp.]|nr:TIGR04053 family radical SAM/SPASM domain-containing protein [Nitrolancea sp.]